MAEPDVDDFHNILFMKLYGQMLVPASSSLTTTIILSKVLPLGIKLTIVEPGPFRTRFAGSSFQHAVHTIEDYRDTAGTFREKIKLVDGKQEGDPEKAAAVIVKLVSAENPPLRLVLGAIAVASVRSKIESVLTDLQNCEGVARQVLFS